MAPPVRGELVVGALILYPFEPTVTNGRAGGSRKGERSCTSGRDNPIPNGQTQPRHSAADSFTSALSISMLGPVNEDRKAQRRRGGKPKRRAQNGAPR